MWRRVIDGDHTRARLECGHAVERGDPGFDEWLAAWRESLHPVVSVPCAECKARAKQEDKAEAAKQVGIAVPPQPPRCQGQKGKVRCTRAVHAFDNSVTGLCRGSKGQVWLNSHGG